MGYPERELVTVVVDLAHFTHSVRGMDATDIASLVDRFYHEVHRAAGEHDGRVVKHLGDGCLVVFDREHAMSALEFVDSLSARIDGLGQLADKDLAVGANVHLCTVAEGEFGPDHQYDIVGAGVIHTFRMGGGAGVRISEPIYRKLPSDRRSGWVKHRPPATYTAVAS
jgi:class 3 adenylate cyclase